MGKINCSLETTAYRSLSSTFYEPLLDFWLDLTLHILITPLFPLQLLFLLKLFQTAQSLLYFACVRVDPIIRVQAVQAKASFDSNSKD